MAKKNTTPADDTTPTEGKVIENAEGQTSADEVNNSIQEKPDGDPAGFYCYIGPTIVGLIQHGAIFRGTRKEALSAAKEAIEKQPLIKTLIVPGSELPTARLKVKMPGNALYKNFWRVAGR